MSNLVKGLRTAINNHYIPGRVSIYLMGDDITTGDGRIDSTLEQIGLNIDVTKRKLEYTELCLPLYLIKT